MRTVFNLLGPLTNPAGATAQLVGAPRNARRELMAGALAALGLERGFVVHGSDGLDEITTTGPTLVFEIRDGDVERRTLEPADFAVPTAAAKNCAVATKSETAKSRAPCWRESVERRGYRDRQRRGGAGGGGTRRNVSRRSGYCGGVDRFRSGAAQSGGARGG